jgi:hypothetical protein
MKRGVLSDMLVIVEGSGDKFRSLPTREFQRCG